MKHRHNKTWNKWTESEDAKLIELVNQGLTNKEVCDQLNMNRHESNERNKLSVSHRVTHLKKAKMIEGVRRTKSSKDIYYGKALQGIENFKSKTSRTKHKLADSTTNISKENYDLILKMDKRNEADGLSPNSRINYITHLKTFALKLGKKSLKDATLDNDIIPYMTELQKRLEGTASSPHRSTLKFFYNNLYRQEKENKELSLISSYFNQKKRNRNQNNIPQEKEHLTKMEVVKLISGIKGKDKISIRNRAVIASLYNSATRVSELVTIRKNDCLLDGKVPRFNITISKTQPRKSPMLAFCLPYLKEWLQVHEFWNQDNPPLFYSLSTSNYGEPIEQYMVGLIVRKAIRISGIKKKISPHNLRHSKAFHSAIDGMIPSEANDLFGWGRTSSMFIYYTKLSDEEKKNRELERAGKLTPEQIEERKLERNAFILKKCKRCGAHSTPDQFLCSRCGLALNKEVAEAEIKREKKKNTEIADLKTQIQDMPKQILELLKENPEDLRKALKI